MYKPYTFLSLALVGVFFSLKNAEALENVQVAQPILWVCQFLG